MCNRWQKQRRKLDAELSGMRKRDDLLCDAVTRQNRVILADRKHCLQLRHNLDIEAEHQSAVTFLTAVFDHIILPEFDVVNMTRRKTRLSGVVSRQMRSMHFGKVSLHILIIDHYNIYYATVSR